MKKIYLPLVFCLLMAARGFAQFGPDVTVDSDPYKTQNNTTITTAFNGWIYVGFSTYQAGTNSGGVKVMRSTDRGATFQEFMSFNNANVRYPDVDIEITGTTQTSLVLYMVYNVNGSGGDHTLHCDKFDGNTGAFLGYPFVLDTQGDEILDCDITTDYLYPAVGSSPYALGVIYSRRHSPEDSICVLTSMDAGGTWAHKSLHTTPLYFNEVSMAYGRSSYNSNGRLFASWILRNSPSDPTGDHYRSRTTTYFDGTWESPFVLFAGMTGKFRNTVTSCQVNNQANTDNGLTWVNVAEYDVNGDGTNYELFHTRVTDLTTLGVGGTLISSVHQDVQPDLTFDPVGNQFHLCYMDQGNQILHYGRWNLDFSGGGIVTSQYNNGGLSANAFPRVSVSPTDNKAGCTWSASGDVAKFDAYYSTLFVSVDPSDNLSVEFSAYPNPATDEIRLNLDGLTKVNYTLINLEGKVLSQGPIEDQQVLDLRPYASGIYLIRIEAKGKSATQKIVKE